MQRVAEIRDTDALHTREIVARSPFGDVFAVAETITNEEGKKVIRNTLKDKEVPQEKAVETKTETHSNNASQAKKTGFFFK